MKSDREFLNRRRCRAPRLRPFQNVVASACFAVGDILESVAVRVFQRYNSNGVWRKIDRDLLAFVAEPTKPKAQNGLTLSAYGSGRRQIEQVAILRALAPAVKHSPHVRKSYFLVLP